MTSSQKSELKECPLCMENLELDDLNFFPCKCKYQVCRFCWNRIITSENGLCPACRRPYNSEEPASFQPMTNDEIKQLKRRQKTKMSQVDDVRKELMDKRVLQPNLLFVANIPPTLPLDEDVLRSDEYFGKYGQVVKVVLTHTTSNASSTTNAVSNCSVSTSTNSMTTFTSAYITYRDKRSAFLALLELNRVGLHGHRTMKVSLGTTKYCSQYLKGLPCSKKECMYLHQRADVRASFTKEEMTAGKHTQYEQELLENFLRELSPNTYPEGPFLTLKAPPKPLLECPDRRDSSTQQQPYISSTATAPNQIRSNMNRTTNYYQQKSLRENNISHSSGTKKHPNSKSLSGVTHHYMTQRSQPHTSHNVPSTSQHDPHSLSPSRSRQNSEPSPVIPFVPSGESGISLNKISNAMTTVAAAGITSPTTVISTPSTSEIISCDPSFNYIKENIHCNDLLNRESGDSSSPHYQVNNNSTYVFPNIHFNNREKDVPSLFKPRSHHNHADEDHSWLLEIVTENLSNLHQMAREEEQSQNGTIHKEQHVPLHSMFATSISSNNFQHRSSTTLSSTSQDIPPTVPPPCGPPPGFEDMESFRHSMPCFSNCAPSETYSTNYTATPSIPFTTSLTSSSEQFTRCQAPVHPSYSSDSLSSYSIAQKQLSHLYQHLSSDSLLGVNGPLQSTISTSLTSSSSYIQQQQHQQQQQQLQQQQQQYHQQQTSKWINGGSTGNESSFLSAPPQIDSKGPQEMSFDVYRRKPTGTLPANQKDLSEMLKTILPIDATIRFGSDVSHLSSLASGSQPTRTINNPNNHSSRGHQTANDSPWSMDDPAIIMSSGGISRPFTSAGSSTLSYQTPLNQMTSNAMKNNDEYYSGSYVPSQAQHQGQHQRLSWNNPEYQMHSISSDMDSQCGMGDSIWSNGPLVNSIHQLQQCHHHVCHGCHACYVTNHKTTNHGDHFSSHHHQQAAFHRLNSNPTNGNNDGTY